MPENESMNAATTDTSTSATADQTGTLQVNVFSALGMIPVDNASVVISYAGDPDSSLMTLTTDTSGQTPRVTLPTPPVSLSLDPETEIQPYAEYNILITADGYEPVTISGSQLFSGELALQPVVMNPVRKR